MMKIRVTNSGESKTNEWHDTIHNYISFSCDYDGSGEETKFSIKRWYGSLDVHGGVKGTAPYNTYFVYGSDNKIIKSIELGKVARKNSVYYDIIINKTYGYIQSDKSELQMKSQILDLYLMYNFLDVRLNKSIHETNNDDIILLRRKIDMEDKEISTEFFKSLGFDTLTTKDLYCFDKNYLSITKKTFNEKKDQWLETIGKINLDEEKKKIEKENNMNSSQKMKLTSIDTNINPRKPEESNVKNLS